MEIRIDQMDNQLFEEIQILKQQNSRGRIVNKFDKVINMEFYSPHRLMAIAIDSVISSPGMMKTRDVVSFVQLRDSAEVGDAVYFTQGEMFFVGMYKVNYENAATWQYTLKSVPVNHSDREKRYHSLMEFLENNGKSGGILDAFLMHRNVRKTISNPTIYDTYFTQLLVQLDKKLSVENLSRFIGLGIGLTPSGDDFITGLLSVLYCYGMEDGNVRDLITDFSSIEFEKKTTLVSFFMIQNMLEANTNQAVYDYLILSGPLEEVVLIGSTSGTDLLVGIGFGFNYLLKRKEENIHGN